MTPQPPVPVGGRITELRDLEGLSIKDAAHMPHPVLLGKWSDQGSYWIDVDRGVFRLSPLTSARARD